MLHNYWRVKGGMVIGALLVLLSIFSACQDANLPQEPEPDTSPPQNIAEQEQQPPEPGEDISVTPAAATIVPGTRLPADPQLAEIIEIDPYHGLLLPLPGYWQGEYHVEFFDTQTYGLLDAQILFEFYEGMCYGLSEEFRPGFILGVSRTPLQPLLENFPEALTEIFAAADYVFATHGDTAYICYYPTGVEYPDDAPELAKERYAAMWDNMKQVLLRFAEENGLTPNPGFFEGSN